MRSVLSCVAGLTVVIAQRAFACPADASAAEAYVAGAQSYNQTSSETFYHDERPYWGQSVETIIVEDTEQSYSLSIFSRGDFEEIVRSARRSLPAATSACHPGESCYHFENWGAPRGLGQLVEAFVEPPSFDGTTKLYCLYSK